MESLPQKFWFLRSLNFSLQIDTPRLYRLSVRPPPFPSPSPLHELHSQSGMSEIQELAPCFTDGYRGS